MTEFAFFANMALLAWMWWTLNTSNNKVRSLEQHLSWAFERKVRERALLVQSRVHLRTFAKAVSMVEMAQDDRIVVTITMDLFARDNLYSVVGNLEEYTPDTFLKDFHGLD